MYGSCYGTWVRLLFRPRVRKGPTHRGDPRIGVQKKSRAFSKFSWRTAGYKRIGGYPLPGGVPDLGKKADMGAAEGPQPGGAPVIGDGPLPPEAVTPVALEAVDPVTGSDGCRFP